MTKEELLESYDWEHAFYEANQRRDAVGEYPPSSAGFTREDVADILYSDEGENDGAPWIGVFRLNDGRFLYVTAGCDYTGWDCQASGSSAVASTLEQLIRFGLVDQDRKRFGLTLEETP